MHVIIYPVMHDKNLENRTDQNDHCVQTTGNKILDLRYQRI